MAAQSKTTAVHFSLIIFVMLSVILGVVALLFFNDYRNQQAEFEQNQSDLREAETAVRQRGDEITALKEVIGIKSEQIGANGGGEETVIGQSQQAIQNLGSNPSSASFLAALKDLRTELNNKTSAIAQQQATIADLNAKLEALNQSYAATEQQHDQKRQQSEQDLASVQAEIDETIKAKDGQIADLRSQTEQLQTDLARAKEQLGVQIAELEDQNAKLVNTAKYLRGELDRAEGTSFEVADGAIVSVDQVGRVVWINLGSNDGLKPRVSFSVYTKGNAGIGSEDPQGGSPDDIKGKIEVTRLLGSDMAEASILQEDGTRPIAQGDPIYSPVWGAGRAEAFAFAGRIDIDGDGNFTGDRERLHELIKAQGAKISAELLPTGERRGGEITQNTRFLVRGEIPRETAAAAGSEEQSQFRELNQKYGEMEKEAEAAGVRTIGLNSFLDFMGFVPQQNRFVPGGSQDWSLEAGSPDRPDRSTPGGNTSKLFETNRNRPTPSSRTSESFGGGQ